MSELQELKRATQELKSALRKLDGSDNRKGVIANIDDVIDRFEGVFNERVLSKLTIVSDALERLDGKAVKEIQSYMDEINIDFDMDKFEDNVVKKVTDKIGTVKFNEKLSTLNNIFVTTVNKVFKNLDAAKIHFDDVTTAIGSIAPQLEKRNMIIIEKMDYLENSIRNINYWLFLTGAAIGGLTVGVYFLLGSM